MTRKLAINTYLGFVIAVSLVVATLLVFYYPIKDVFSVVFFAILAIVAETQTVSLEHDRSVSVSSAIIISAMLILGPGAATIVAAASVCGSITKYDRKVYHIFNTKPIITISNIAIYTLSISLMSLIYFRFGGQLIKQYLLGDSLTGVLYQINQSAALLILTIIAGIVLNTLLISAYIAINSKQNIFRVWIHNLPWTITSLFFVSLFGVIITALYLVYGYFIVILFFVPLILARYVFVTYKDLQHNYLQTVKSLATAIEAKDAYTSGHSRRVEEYALMIAQQMRLSPKRCETLRYAALLHDIGKIGIHEDILNKRDKLNDEEWQQIRTHPETGAHIIEDIEFLSSAVDIIKCHHERYDGTGYPEGRDGEHMPLEAMILCAADAYDAMTSLRPYHQPMTHEEAMNEMRSKAGSQFSPEVVRAFDLAMQKAAKQESAQRPDDKQTDVESVVEQCAAAAQMVKGEKDK